jgi:hypothetical protein
MMLMSRLEQSIKLNMKKSGRGNVKWIELAHAFKVTLNNLWVVL